LSIKIEVDRGLRSLPISIAAYFYLFKNKKCLALPYAITRKANMDAPVDAFSHMNMTYFVNGSVSVQWEGLRLQSMLRILLFSSLGNLKEWDSSSLLDVFMH
jgi:hypothetical protein